MKSVYISRIFEWLLVVKLTFYAILQRNDGKCNSFSREKYESKSCPSIWSCKASAPQYTVQHSDHWTNFDLLNLFGSEEVFILQSDTSTTTFVTQSSFPHRNGEKSFAKVMKKAYLVRFHFRTKTNSIALWRYEDVLSDQHVSTARSKFGKYASMRWVNKMENWSVGTSEKGNVLYTYFGT